MADIKHRIGIMGGTFDPIHMGHLILGEKAYEQFRLEKVLFMPSGNPPHKRNRQGRATDEERVEMVRRAITGNPHFELSLTEMHENGYTYTYHTLEMLKEKNPDTDYYFIIGADSLYDFDTWREPERICRNCILVTAVRNHSTIAELEAEMNRLSLKYNGTFLTLNTTNLDVSSEMLRNWISEDKSVRYYIPDPVIEYIRENQIYSLAEKKDLPMAEYDFIKMQKKLAKYLDEDRYEHTLGVMFTCAALAMVHDCDLITAQTAGLLHDCAKCIPNKKKLKMCSQHHISVSEFEQEHPFLLHAKLGAYVAKAKYDVTDENILSAITWHTTGKPEMTLLEKIVYIADYIEPKRDKAPNLAIVRKLAFQDLDECMYKILADTLAYLEENPKDIDNATKDAFLYYRDLHVKRQS